MKRQRNNAQMKEQTRNAESPNKRRGNRQAIWKKKSE